MLVARFLTDEHGVGSPADHDLEVLRRERLREVIPGAETQRLDTRLDAGVARHHDDDRVRVGGQGRLQQLQAIDLRHVQIHQRNVEGPALEQVQGVVAPGAHRHIVAFIAEQDGAGFTQRVFVVYDQRTDLCLGFRVDR